MRQVAKAPDRNLETGIRGISAIAQIKPIVEAYFNTGQLAEGVSIVHKRSRGRGVLLRVPTERRCTVVVKAWAATRMRDRLKKVTGLSNARREWRMHQRLYAAGLPMPEPLAYRLWSTGACSYEMLVVEDLGKLVRSMVCLKHSIRRGDADEVRRIEDTILDMTVRMLAAGVSDIDHQLNNIVMAADGRLVRLDVECATHWRFRTMSEEALGAMIGRLVSTHAFACQPDLAHTEDFANRLAQAIEASPGALRHAKTRIDAALARQRLKNGPDSQLSLAW